jgi:hypothetical protein
LMPCRNRASLALLTAETCARVLSLGAAGEAAK